MDLHFFKVIKKYYIKYFDNNIHLLKKTYLYYNFLIITSNY